MTVKLNRISVMPLALLLSIFHAVVGAIVGVVVTAGSLFNQENEGIWGLGAWAILVLPIVNAALGFLTGMFIAGTYNMIAQWLGGGIELEFEQEGSSMPSLNFKNEAINNSGIS